MTVPNSEFDRLGSDGPTILAVLQGHPTAFEPLADVTEPARHTYHMAIAELAWHVWYHATGVYHMLENHLEPPLLAVQRAMYEALINLAYLYHHPDHFNEAVVFQAYSHLKDMDDFPDDVELIKDRQDVLRRMPQEQVALATKRARTHPRTWSGMNMGAMAAAGQVQGFERLYGYLSGRAHASRLGNYVRLGPITADGQREISYGKSLTPQDIEYFANFARRALHAAFHILWSELNGPKISFPGPDPATWEWRDPEPGVAV